MIDTVLLDMDGTLLDLKFDNEFWLATLPREYARRQQITLEEAHAYLDPIFTRESGTLNWYCLDFWSHTLGFSVAQLKTRVAQRYTMATASRGLFGSPQGQSLQGHSGDQCPCRYAQNQATEQINLMPWFDRVFSSHEFGEPKESRLFWQRLNETEPFSLHRTVFIDDSEAVLASAQRFGIKHLITLRQPDSFRRYSPVNSLSGDSTFQ